MKFSVLSLVLSISSASAFGVVLPDFNTSLGAGKSGTRTTTTTISTTQIASSAAKSCPFDRFLGKKNVYSKPTRKPKMIERISQRFQMRTISRPNGLLAKTIQPLLSIMEGSRANDAEYLSFKRAAFGENFCAAGQVVLGEWEEVSTALTSPQARTLSLGTAPLSPLFLPEHFLLKLSQEGADGDGSHEVYNGAFSKYIMDAAEERQRDAVALKLMDQLVEDYNTMSHERDGAFFKSDDGGLLPFLTKYLHYCMFGIDPEDKAIFDTLHSFYYPSAGAPPALFYFKLFGLGFNIAANKNAFSADKARVEEIYENSPQLSTFPEGSAELRNLTKKDFSVLILPLMAIAATAGPRHLIETALGQLSIRKYFTEEDIDTSQIEQIEFLDKIDLDDKDEVMGYMLECGRLNQPVGHTHRVATEDFTVKMRGRNRTFPKGTKISIPINMSCMNENLYGDTTFEFDHKRPNLAETSTIFHSVGREHAGRMCPGTSFAMTMISEILTKIGKTRR